jgi:hypothetical protein
MRTDAWKLVRRRSDQDHQDGKSRDDGDYRNAGCRKAAHQCSNAYNIDCGKRDEVAMEISVVCQLGNSDSGSEKTPSGDLDNFLLSFIAFALRFVSYQLHILAQSDKAVSLRFQV